MFASAPPSVLSIQSHVVHGYVGNRCATFCLQRLGIDVEAIHTVQFSNHTGHSHVRGTTQTGPDLLKLYEGLELNGFSPHSHVLTGYMGTAEMLESVVQIVKRAKKRNAETVFVCDPVMGDAGELYVPRELVEIYRSSVIPIADVIVPNQLEAELLAETQITDVPSADAACRRLHDIGPDTVVISSLEIPDDDGQDVLTLFASTVKPQTAGHPSQFLIRVPKIDYHFFGTGDLFAALILALSIDRPSELDWVCVQAASRLHSLIETTFERDPSAAPNALHLDLIGRQDLLVQPRAEFVVVPCRGAMT